MLSISENKFSDQIAKKNRFVPSIQALRACAALMVVIGHTPGAFIQAGFNSLIDIPPLQVGVDIFFVVSGFVMVHSCFNRKIQGPVYFFMQRLARIIPLYWLFTSVAVGIFIHDHRHEVIHLSQVRLILTSYLFWPHANDPSMNWSVPIYAVGWTLNFEMFFYAIFSLSLLIRSYNVRYIVLISIMIFGVMALHYFQLRLPFALWFDPVIMEFVYGMIAAILFDRGIVFYGRYSLCALAASIIIFCTGSWFKDQFTASLGGLADFWRPLLWGLPSGLFVFSMISQKYQYRNRLGQFLMSVGSSSYSIYLSHSIILELIAQCMTREIFLRFLRSVPIIVETIVICIAILLGHLCYFFIERPLHRHAKNLVAANKNLDRTFVNYMTMAVRGRRVHR